MITDTGYDGIEFVLVDKETGNPVEQGERITTFRGEEMDIESVKAPHKPSSTGHVNGLYAQVFGLGWKKL